MKLLKSKVLWSLLSITALVLFFLQMMPEPIDMDLDKIGNGNNSIVFIYDPNLALSNQQATEINKAKTMTSVTINFLVARQGDPNSQSFREQYQASSLDLLFFNSSGQLTGRGAALLTASDLIEMSNQ